MHSKPKKAHRSGSYLYTSLCCYLLLRMPSMDMNWWEGQTSEAIAGLLWKQTELKDFEAAVAARGQDCLIPTLSNHLSYQVGII